MSLLFFSPLFSFLRLSCLLSCLLMTDGRVASAKGDRYHRCFRVRYFLFLHSSASCQPQVFSTGSLFYQFICLMKWGKKSCFSSRYSDQHLNDTMCARFNRKKKEKNIIIIWSHHWGPTGSLDMCVTLNQCVFFFFSCIVISPASSYLWPAIC